MWCRLPPYASQVDVTIGSALDIFGGALPYDAVVRWDATQAAAAAPSDPPGVCPFHLPALPTMPPEWRVAAAVAAVALVGLYAFRRRA